MGRCGGLEARPDYFAGAMYIATTETIGGSVRFDSLVFGRREELSAPWWGGALSDGMRDIASILSTEHSEFKLQAVSQTA